MWAVSQILQDSKNGRASGHTLPPLFGQNIDLAMLENSFHNLANVLKPAALH